MNQAESSGRPAWSGQAALRRWSAATACLAAVALGPSFRFWFQAEPYAIAHEFDWWAGLVPGTPWILAGKMVFAVCFLAMGFLYVAACDRLRRHPPPDLQPVLQAGWLPWLVFLLGWPMVSPDVFYYLAKGSLEVHYGLNPFTQAITDIPGYQTDPLLHNVHPAFVDRAGNYGPAFQMICAAIAWLGGGSLPVCLFFFKLLCLGCLVFTVWTILQIRPPGGARPGETLFLTAGSPLLLFTFLSCAHNDALLAAGLAGALLLAGKDRPFFCGGLLGVIFAIKYITLIVTPLFGLYFLRNSRHPWSAALAIVAGFLAAAVPPHLFYPESWGIVVGFAGTGYETMRASLTLWLMLPPWPDLETAFTWVKRSQQLLYIVLWCALASRWAFAPRFALPDLCRAGATAFLLYFVLAAQMILEWYFLWAWVFLAAVPGRGGRRWWMTLSAFYLGGTIFTVGSPPTLAIAANLLLYLLLLAASLPLLLANDLWLRKNPLPSTRPT